MGFDLSDLKKSLPNIEEVIAEVGELASNEEVGMPVIYDLFSYFSTLYKKYGVNLSSPEGLANSEMTDILCEERVQQIIDYTWEKLNTGSWKNVHISWRYTYSYASIIKVLILCKKGNLEAAVKACDMGLLMGAPVLNNLLSNLASSLASYIDQEPVIKKFQAPPLKKFRADAVDITLNHPINHISQPSIDIFYRIMCRKEPVIVSNTIDHWPALDKWNLDYLISIAGSRTVPIEIGSRYTEENWSQKLITLKTFIEQYIYKCDETGYLAQHELFNQIPEMKSDIVIPDYCCVHMNNLKQDNENIEINAWFGPKGTISPLHYDPKHNLLAQVMGQKYVRLYHEKYSDLLYPFESKLLCNTSQVDVENPNDEKFPKFSSAPFVECLLKPGEMLYIPPKCWHFVKSLSVSFSVSFWWE